MTIKYEFGFDAIAELANCDDNYIYQSRKRGELKDNDLFDLCTWLAENGQPKLRAEMARRLLPTVIGAKGRPSVPGEDVQKLLANFDLLRTIFESESRIRSGRGKKISKTKSSAPPKRTAQKTIT